MSPASHLCTMGRKSSDTENVDNVLFAFARLNYNGPTLSMSLKIIIKISIWKLDSLLNTCFVYFLVSYPETKQEWFWMVIYNHDAAILIPAVLFFQSRICYQTYWRNRHYSFKKGFVYLSLTCLSRKTLIQVVDYWWYLNKIQSQRRNTWRYTVVQKQGVFCCDPAALVIVLLYGKKSTGLRVQESFIVLILLLALCP